MHEIITLQLGQRANYVATHFWNTQESYFTYSADETSFVDHDIHFRPGIGADGSETFTPRTVIYDLKGGFGSLKKLNALYELQEESPPQALWNGPTVVQRQAPIEQNEYQKGLEEGVVRPHLTSESVRYWSDFNRVYYHPRSIVQSNDYELNSTLMPFERWNMGEELFNDLDKEHDLLDRDLRPFAEEADQMQGIQLIASIDDAWGGFAARYMDRLRDEYGKTTVWAWGLEDGIRNTAREKRHLKLSNTARSTVEISPHASLFIPMTVPVSLPSYVNIDRHSPWHVSALLSTALESMTLPSRLQVRHGLRETLDGIAASLNVNGNQNIVKLQMSVSSKAASEQQNGDQRSGRLEVQNRSMDSRLPSQDRRGLAPEPLDEDDTPLDMNFFPSDEPDSIRGRHSSKKIHVFGRAEAFRGTNESDDEHDDEFDGQHRAKRRALGLPISHKSWTPLPYSILDSFPRIYSATASSHSPDSLSVHTSLSTDSAVASRVKSLRATVSRAIGVEEREALTNSLGEIAEAYEEGWDSGSDEDDD